MSEELHVQLCKFGFLCVKSWKSFNKEEKTSFKNLIDLDFYFRRPRHRCFCLFASLRPRTPLSRWFDPRNSFQIRAIAVEAQAKVKGLWIEIERVICMQERIIHQKWFIALENEWKIHVLAAIMQKLQKNHKRE